MYTASVPVALQALDQALILIDKAAPEMLAARLHPGMFDCAGQFCTVASFALRGTFPLTDREPPDLPQTDPYRALEIARAAVMSLQPTDFADADHRRIVHRAGFADLNQSAQAYLQHFAQPNLWFHLSMAFAILRQHGADIGKTAFDGLHEYPTGFAFDD